ncbi:MULTISPECIES: hypothetical protein [unclassified Mesorhizobium]|uniref:hypothetical protein n=1 Tax=unclassified Mesorhizobium TaxID=325217 RepID=UPI00167CB854|nr:MULTISPECIES: hypothetical protein [unclassified Mesorhizobium]
MFENIIRQVCRQRPGKSDGSSRADIVLHRATAMPSIVAKVANAQSVRVNPKQLS